MKNMGNSYPLRELALTQNMGLWEPGRPIFDKRQKEKKSGVSLIETGYLGTYVRLHTAHMHMHGFNDRIM